MGGGWYGVGGMGWVVWGGWDEEASGGGAKRNDVIQTQRGKSKSASKSNDNSNNSNNSTTAAYHVAPPSWVQWMRAPATGESLSASPTAQHQSALEGWQSMAFHCAAGTQ